MKINIKYILITTFILITILLIVVNLPMFDITSVVLTGNAKITQEEVEDVIVGQDVKNIFWISDYKVEKAIENLPYVKEAKVSKTLPGQLNIDINEREPIAYLLYNKDSYIYMDNEGYALEVSSEPLENSPLITGVNFGNFILNEPLNFEDEYTLQMINTLCENIEKYNLGNYEITIDLSQDFNVKLIINDITVGLGEFEDIDKKMRYLKSILEELDDLGYLSGYIDLSDFNRPITFKYSIN